MNSDLVPVQFGSLSSNVYYERENQFRRDSVRIATTGGVTRPQLSSDLWGGQSTPESKNDQLRFFAKLCRSHGHIFCAWRAQPMSQCQHDDMAMPAHIREQRHLSLQSYGRPRMSEKLHDLRVVRWAAARGPPEAPEWYRDDQDPEI